MVKALAAVLAMVLSTGFSIMPATADLAWLAGHWVQDGADGWAEENWAPPRAGVMLGTGLTGKGSVAKSFEFMRIADGPGHKVVFWGSPEGRAPVAFPMVAQGRWEVTFENAKHDYPTRISYKRERMHLTATTTGRGGIRPMRWRYRLKGR